MKFAGQFEARQKISHAGIVFGAETRYLGREMGAAGAAAVPHNFTARARLLPGKKPVCGRSFAFFWLVRLLGHTG